MPDTKLLPLPVDLLRFAPQPVPPELAAELQRDGFGAPAGVGAGQP